MAPPNRDYLVENTFEFIEQDMVIRLESLQIELEKIERDALFKIQRIQEIQSRLERNFKSNVDKISKISHRKNLNDNRETSLIRKVENTIENVDKISKKLDVDECMEKKNNSNKIINLSTQIKSLRKLVLYARSLSHHSIEGVLNSRNNESNRKVFKRPNPFPFVENKSSSLVSKTIIGYLNCQTTALALDRRLSLENSCNFRVKVVNLRDFLVSACGLAEVFTAKQKYELIVTDFNNGSVKFFRKFDMHLANETEMTSVVKKTGYFKFKGFGLYPICTDLEFVVGTRATSKPCENVYVCDMDLPRVLIFDIKMERLKRIIYSTKSVISDPKEEFDCPRDICYHAGLLYVLDQGKRMVNIFTRSGDYVNDFDYERLSGYKIENAWSVRVSRNVIAVIDWLQTVYIFDAEFNLRSVIQEPCVTSMCLVNDCFKGDQATRHVKLFLHTENGDFVAYRIFNSCEDSSSPLLILRKHFDRLRYRSEFMIYSSSQQIILSLGWSKSIALIDF